MPILLGSVSLPTRCWSSEGFVYPAQLACAVGADTVRDSSRSGKTDWAAIVDGGVQPARATGAEDEAAEDAILLYAP
jgi:hypothetical protein